MATPPVGPTTSTTVPIAYDTDAGGFGGPLDMGGPLVGTVTYSQGPAGELVLRVDLEFGQPSTTYDIFLVGGPSHAMSTGFVVIGALGTDAVGAGSAGAAVPHGVLAAGPFGPGYRTDHVDLLAGVGDLGKGALTAGAINYFVCREQPHGDQRSVAAATGEMRAEKGDPLGSYVERAGADPLAGEAKP
jgi:hypothetical protein